MKTIKITTEVKLSDKEVEFLKNLDVSRHLEYRDPEFDDISEFKKSEVFKDLDWFLKRNEGGTYKIADSLYDKGILELVDDCWHITYKLSRFGKKVKKEIL